MMRTLFFASSLSLLLVLCVANSQPHQAHHHAHQHAAEVEELIVTLKQSDDMRFDAHLSAFVDYTRSFDKRYTSVSEFLLRLENYKASMKRVALLQAEAGDVTQFGPTIFSDMSDKEFESTMLMDSPFLGLSEPGAIPSENQHDVTPPTTAHMLGDDKVVDWRPTGIVTPVKNQGRCGSCWAFSTVEELESMWALKNNNTLSIGSTQQLVSCAPTEGGCGGGWPYRSYGYINTAGGLLTEQEYPYTSGTTGVTGTCTDPKTKRTIGIYNGTPNFGYATTSGACFFGTCDTQNMQQVVDVLKNRGPASVCVNATPWRDYVGGVLKAAQCPHASNTINHCVQAVGYNLNDATPYFIIRNSWGAGWGLAGYLNIEIAGNACGVGNVATVPFIRGSWD